MLPLFAFLAACVESEPESASEPPSDSLDASAHLIAPTRYVTHFVFAGVEGSVFFGSFAQETSERALLRTYDAWWAGPDGWTALVQVRDTLPVPRAAWRVLPAANMGVQVGETREVVGLTFSTPEGRVALRAGEEASVWTGPTGQRESMGLASLEVDGHAASGILWFRRAARALQFPGDPRNSHAFVLADSAGNGLLIEMHGDDGTAIARTWLHGAVAAWDDVMFVPDSTSADDVARRWRFEIPAAALSGTIRAIEDTPSGSAPAFRIECNLEADGSLFRFAGLSAPLPLP